MTNTSSISSLSDSWGWCRSGCWCCRRWSSSWNRDGWSWVSRRRRLLACSALLAHLCARWLRLLIVVARIEGWSWVTPCRRLLACSALLAHLRARWLKLLIVVASIVAPIVTSIIAPIIAPFVTSTVASTVASLVASLVAAATARLLLLLRLGWHKRVFDSL